VIWLAAVCRWPFSAAGPSNFREMLWDPRERSRGMRMMVLVVVEVFVLYAGSCRACSTLRRRRISRGRYLFRRGGGDIYLEKVDDIPSRTQHTEALFSLFSVRRIFCRFRGLTS
jgi:hypothetical protein